MLLKEITIETTSEEAHLRLFRKISDGKAKNVNLTAETTRTCADPACNHIHSTVRYERPNQNLRV